MPHLRDLKPQFVRYETKIEPAEFVVGDQATWHERGCPTETRIGPHQYRVFVDSFADAQGIWFLCPKCVTEHESKLTPEQRADPEAAGVGIHSCEVSFSNRGMTDDQGSHNAEGKPTRWDVTGDNFDNLSTQPSILLIGGCGWHGYITNGKAE